jgi:hypothetical protein
VRQTWQRLCAWTSGQALVRDAWLATLAALVLRIGVVAWAARQFPPAADGRFYQVVAARMARGLGYTWLWPDGAVTHAAHYPVGYPAMLAVLYRAFSPEPFVAMLMNAVWGSVAVFAVHRAAARGTNRGGALLAAALVALHPALIAYTAALMTEGVLAALVACLGWITVAAIDARPSRRWRLAILLGLVSGVGSLLRPQTLLLAPILGALGMGGVGTGWRRRLGGAVLASVLGVMVCLPWTARNCVRMERCVFVSANGGWNLLIGTATAGKGAWVPIETVGIPVECRNVFGEADKDACFGRAAWRRIAEDPLGWLSLAPQKLAATFDTAAASSGYLSESNALALGSGGKVRLAGAETVWQRLLVAIALGALARTPGPRRRLRVVVGVLAGLGLLTHAGWPSYLGLVLAALLLGRSLLERTQAALAAAAVLVTALTHVVFFGADRYALVCCGVLAMLAGTVWPDPGESRRSSF